MKYPLRIPRMPSKLSDSLHLRLNTYALAASTAGVGMLALAQTVDAKIVHTPVYEKIPPTFGWIWFPISLTNNGVYDGAFANVDTFSIKQLWFDAYGGAGFIMGPLSAGRTIGPKGPFEGSGRMADAYSKCEGPWGDVHDRYLGLEFQIKGKIHYGWVRMNVTCHTHVVHATITGYAYETIPNKAIIAGKTKGRDVVTVQPNAVPGSLGRLALGRK